MLDGNIFVSHRLCLVLGIDQDFIEVLGQINLSASGYLRQLLKCYFRLIRKLLTGDSHLCDQL